MKRSLFAPWPGTPARRRLALLAFVVTGLTLGSGGIAANPSTAAHDHTGHRGRSMSIEEMNRVANEWFASHPVKLGASPEFQGAFADTFTASGFTFDNNGFTLDNPDTAKIFVGETVLWRWIDGVHTVTNGRDSFDPEAGTIFNGALNVSNPALTFTFGTPGVYPFFCIVHELEIMTGFVRVSEITGVTPIGEATGRVGFVSSPAPNPSRTGFLFRFALAKSGRVIADVYDPAGRRVTRAFDRELEPGTFAAVWDGKSTDGARVRPGAYFLRLRGPDMSDSRKVVVEQ